MPVASHSVPSPQRRAMTVAQATYWLAKREFYSPMWLNCPALHSTPVMAWSGAVSLKGMGGTLTNRIRTRESASRNVYVCGIVCCPCGALPL